MPAWYYFSRPTHSTFHDLTTTRSPPENLRQLLGLGLKFIVTPKFTNNYTHVATTTLLRLQRDLLNHSKQQSQIQLMLKTKRPVRIRVVLYVII